MRDGETGDFFMLICFVMALYLLFAFGCAPAPVVACATACGMSLGTPVYPVDALYLGQGEWTCEEFQSAETTAVEALRTYGRDPRLQHTCEAVSGYRVYVQPEINFTSPDGANVAGLNFCSTRTIYVGNVSPMQSALAHEIAHAAQRCAPLLPVDPKDPDHSNWERDGVYNSLRAASAVANDRRLKCFGKNGDYIGPLDGGVCT